jgi:hypothetical protein
MYKGAEQMTKTNAIAEKFRLTLIIEHDALSDEALVGMRIPAILRQYSTYMESMKAGNDLCEYFHTTDGFSLTAIASPPSALHCSQLLSGECTEASKSVNSASEDGLVFALLDVQPEVLFQSVSTPQMGRMPDSRT